MNESNEFEVDEPTTEVVQVERITGSAPVKVRSEIPVPKVFPVTQQLLKRVRLDRNDRLYVRLNEDGTNFVVTVTNVGPAKVPSVGARSGWLNRIPARKQNVAFVGHQYTLEATDCTAIVIATLWPSDQVIFEEDALLVYRYLLATVCSQERTIELVSRYQEYEERKATISKLAVPVPYVLEGYHEPTVNDELPLALYQRVAATCALMSEGYALFKEQGTGKTPTAIAVLCEEAKRFRQRELENNPSKRPRLYRAILVVPKNVRVNWTKEIERFATVPGKTTILRKGALHRTQQIIEAMIPDDDDQVFTAIICNYESLVGTWETIGAIGWDLAALDESHFIKSARAKRTKYTHRLRDVASKRMILTGTPITNTAMDLWAQLEFLGKGFSGFQSNTTFREFYGVFQVDGEGFRRLISVQNLPFMQERLARISFVIRKEDALPGLPEKVYDVYEVEMTDDQRDVYESVRTKLMAEIESDLEQAENKQLTVNNVLTKLLRLAQITSGFVTWDEMRDEEGNVVTPKRVEHFPTNAKLDGLVELLKDPDKTSRDKTLIWACWIPDIRAISERLTKEGIKHVTYYGGTKDADREEAERLYNEDPETRVFIGNPAAGGVGLNLLGYPPGRPEDAESNTTHEIYYSQNWSPTARSQSEDRGHRRGTRVHVRITDLMVPDTIDEEIRARVTDKRTSALEITDLRAILRRCLGSNGNARK